MTNNRTNLEKKEKKENGGTPPHPKFFGIRIFKEKKDSQNSPLYPITQMSRRIAPEVASTYTPPNYKFTNSIIKPLGECTRAFIEEMMNENENSVLVKDECVNVTNDTDTTVIINDSFERDTIDRMSASDTIRLEWDVDETDDESLEKIVKIFKNINIPETMIDEGSEGLFSDDELLDDNDYVELPKVEHIELDYEKAAAEDDVKDEKESSSKDKRVMRWCFTLNNPDTTGDEFAEMLKGKKELKGFVFQLEEGTNGTKHFQGYLEFHTARRFTTVKTLLGNRNAHIESAKGTKEQNLKYCTKEDGRKEGPWIWGTCTDKRGPGKRNDLDDFARMIDEEGGLTDEVCEAFPGHALQFRRHAKERANDIALKKAKEKEMEYWKEQRRLKEAGLEWEGQKQMKCRLLFGPTAVGKTSHVMIETVGRGIPLYKKKGNNKWYEGYADETSMVVDEFNTGFCEGDIRNFNEYTNTGVNIVEVKGSSTLLLVEEAWFTTNKHPLDIWSESKDNGTYKAFARRFAEVYWWNDARILKILKNPGDKDKALDAEQWKKDFKEWMSFWNGKPVAGMSIVPGEDIKDYFTFGCHQ